MNNLVFCYERPFSSLIDIATMAFQGLRRALPMVAICLALVAPGLICPTANAQTNEWTWMSGSIAAGSFGTYGTLGTPAPENAPGARSQPVTWTDSKGNLWLLGGYGLDSGNGWGYLNDLWRFNPSTNEWTWMGGTSTVTSGFAVVGVYGTEGTPAAANIPSGRAGAVGWTDTSGNLWLFGGWYQDNESGAIDNLNDLWKFNPTTNQWTWMNGSNTPNQSGVSGTQGTPALGNSPGAEGYAFGWKDNNGNFWLFGGDGLWEFYPSVNQWALIDFRESSSCSGVYGSLGKADPGNLPSNRSSAVSWTDKSGNLWMFGGMGCDSKGIGGNLNDLWKYSPSTNQWTWMGGADTIGQPGVYGTLQMPAAGNMPGGRINAVAWTDSKGNFWMFGGLGSDSTGTESLLNDLWEYNPSTSEWIWMGGSADALGGCAILGNWCGQFGVYGTLQTPALGNAPGGRYFAVGWTDIKGDFWLFGGAGYDALGISGYLSDLWEFQPNTGGQPVTATPTFSPGSGTYTSWQTVTITDTTPGATIEYLIDGNTPATVYNGPIIVSSSETIEAIASANGYANSNIATANFVANLPRADAPAFSLRPGNYATAQTLKISDNTPGATIHYAIGAVPTAGSTVYTGPITVSSTETVEAIAVADDYLDSKVTTAAYNIGPNPAAEWTWMGGSNTIPSCSVVYGCGQPGWYGTLNTPAASNRPGGRTLAATWTDSIGRLWLFGGTGFDSTGILGSLNDLWEFNPSTSEWTWMGGSSTIPINCDRLADFMPCGQPGSYGTLGTSAAGNMPGGRESAASWTDNKGNLWLFGGLGFDANSTNGNLNDLWEFNPTSNEWTWRGGSDSIPCAFCGLRGVYGTFAAPAAGNIPGTRSGATMWTDHNGNAWMYGGVGEDANGVGCHLNDLWEFNSSAGEWAWWGGSKSCTSINDTGIPGVYGTVGVFAAGNNPWSLQTASGWVDSTNHLWLFGGSGVDLYSVYSYLNDMWEFDPSIREWAWMSANSGLGGGYGVYGGTGDWAPGNIPGERWIAASWTDNNNNFWLFGGAGLGGYGKSDYLNDLWEFKPSINEWAWMGGSFSPSQPGVYGTLGAPSTGSVPGGRGRSATWTDKNGNLWLFGGSGYDSQTSIGLLNDLWQYGLSSPPSAPPPSPSAIPTFSLTPGTYGTPQMLTISASLGAKIFYTTDGTTPNSGSMVYQGQISILSSETVEAVAVTTGHSISAVATAAYTISNPQTATPAFSVPGGTYDTAQTVTISDATAGSAIYYTTNGNTPTASSTQYTGAITVSTSMTIQAIAVASGYANSAVASAAYTISLPPTFTFQASPSALTVSSGGRGTITLTVTPQNGFSSAVGFACSGLPVGATCSFSPTTVTPSGAAATTVLTISTSSQSAASRPNSRPIFPLAAFAVVLCLFIKKKRCVLQSVMLAAALTGLGLAIGCGGGGTGGNGGGGSGPQPVTSTVTITATAPTVQQTTSVSLTVN